MGSGGLGDGWGIEPVEEVLEGPVGLGAVEDLGAEEVEVPLAHGGFRNRDPALEVALPPRPAGAQGALRVEPCQRAHGTAGRERKDRRVVEEHIHLWREPVGQWLGVVGGDLEHRAGDKELVRRERAAGRALDKVALHRQAELLC